MYTYEQALQESIQYFNHDELAARVFVDKYALRDSDNNLLEKTPDDMHRRLAKEFARIEAKKFKNPLTEEEIFGLFDKFKYLCVSGDNWIQTINGPRQVKNLVGQSFVSVLNNNCYRTISKGFVKTGRKDVFEIKTDQGYSLKVTEDHPILVHTKLDWYLKNQHTDFVQTKNLKIGDKLVLSNNRNNFWDGSGTFNEGWIIGNLIGDGTFSKEAVLDFQRKNTTDFDIAINIVNNTLYNVDNKIKGCKNEESVGKIASIKITELANKYNITRDNKFDLTTIERESSSDFCLGMLRGLFDADGHIFCTETKGRDVSIRLGSIHISMLQQIQRILQRLGIISALYKNRKIACKKNICGRITDCKNFHELRIAKDNILVFIERIGSYFEDKKEKLYKLSKRKFNKERFFCTVSSIELIGEEDVYDCTIEHISRFDCNGIIVHNCPQGSPMYGIGNKHKVVSLSNCYVLNTPEDSYNSILDIDKEIVNISKRRGGVGIDLSKLRPNGFKTNNAAKSSTGIVSWMERYSNSIREVGQNSRRGAMMLTLSIHHPDILEFITIKNNPLKVTGANISVRLTKEFLDAVNNNTDYELRFPIDGPKTFSKMVSAKNIWDTIINSAWLRAEPGLLMWDNVLKGPADCYERYRSVSTNPCSEITLSCMDSCRLLCLNLYSYVVNPFTTESFFDYNLFYKHAQIAQRLMDDLVDLESECIDRIIAKIKSDPESDKIKSDELEMWYKIKSNNDDGRRTGTGITALGDTIAALNVKYGSNDSIKITGMIYKTLRDGCYRSSIDMAKELGAFKEWNSNLEKDNKFLNDLPTDIYQDMLTYGRRNVALTTTAPTGTVSILTQTTSGIEPLFVLKPFIRRKKINPSDTNARVDFKDQNGDCWQEFEIYHTKVQHWMNITGKTDITESPWYNSCANDIDWIKRVELQAKAQQYICHAISSTINLPENVSIDTVDAIYKYAFKNGLKGITIYRDNCRTGVLVNKDNINNKERPKTLKCDVHHITSKGHSYFVLIGFLDNKPYEVFAGKNGFLDKDIKTGTITRKSKKVYKAVFDDEDKTELCPITSTCSDHEETITRLTSALLRSDADLELIVEQLEKVHGDITIFAKCIARVLKKYLKDGTVSGQTCTECGSSNIVRQEGCLTCKECGYGKCG